MGDTQACEVDVDRGQRGRRGDIRHRRSELHYKGQVRGGQSLRRTIWQYGRIAKLREALPFKGR